MDIKNRLRKEADDLFFEACRVKYGNGCMFCGRLYDKAHHFFPKGQYQHLRYDLDNGINLCIEEHSKIHQTGNRKEIEKKIIEKRGREWFTNLRRKANNMPSSFKSEKWYRENIIRLKRYIYEENKKTKNGIES